jgi:class 3 adenylate cyclase/tetratricopeptide (TPR) repeat protein
LTTGGPQPKLACVDCPACGHGNRAQAKFCEECGAALARRCPNCGEEVRPGARFCDSCGHPLGPAGTDLPGLDASAGVEGERRTVTVLFADAVGSTSMAERLGEEEMYSLMQGCFARMMDAVHAYEGHVASFTGDGIMAVFGAPVAREESERRAVTAALTMQRLLGDYAREVNARYPVECRFRIGLHTGPVVVGKVSGELNMDFTAVGDTVNLAARMQTLAEPGSVYLTEPTYRGVAEHIDCEAVGPLAVKGKDAPVAAWRALREKPARTRLERAAERGLAPFVGRDVEFATLERQLARVRNGRGQVVFVSGDAGMGKSRLLLELRRRAGPETRWLQGDCSPFGRSVPYLPVVDLLKRAFSVEEGDDETQVINRVEAATAGWREDARATRPYLRYLLSVDPGDPVVARMDPRERRAGVLDGLRALLHEESARSPLVVVFEDLHWIDEPSEQALAALVDAVPTLPVLLVLTHRPGYVHPLERGYTTHVAVEPLTEEESAALVRGVLAARSIPPELDRLVTGTAEGNPFFTEEVLQSLTEEGVLAPSDGGYVLTRALYDVRIPDTVQEVILSRIDRLERQTKAALQLASVIGRVFTVRLLDRISDLEARLEQSLSELKRLELIYEKAWFPELAYMFRHALTHDVAYSTLLAERRRAVHRLVAAAIEELYADRLTEYFETLAHHYFEGQEWGKALEYLGKAADKAAAAFANQDALDYYARGLEVCEKLGDSTLAIQATLGQRRAYVNFFIGRFPEAIADMNGVLEAAKRIGDEHRRGIALAYRGVCELYNHQPSAEATLRQAMAVGEQSSDDEVRAAAGGVLGLVCVVGDRHDEAEPFFDSAKEFASSLTDPFMAGYWRLFESRLALWKGQVDLALQISEEHRPAIDGNIFTRLQGRWHEAHARATLGEYEGARRILEETLSACERVGDIVTRVRCANTLGYVYGELFDFARAMDWNQRSLDLVLATRAPVPEVEMNARLNLAENLLAQGRLEEAELHFRVVEAEIRRPRINWMVWRYAERVLAGFGEWWLVRGDPARALSHADECLARAERSRSRKNIVKARRLRGQAHLYGGRSAQAQTEFAAALELAREVGSPPQIWKTHAAIGDGLLAEGRTQRARQAYREALNVIDGVAVGLTDEELRATFLASDEVGRIREASDGR